MVDGDGVEDVVAGVLLSGRCLVAAERIRRLCETVSYDRDPLADDRRAAGKPDRTNPLDR